MTLAPFPTGPLAVWGADLARAMFVDCQYLHKYLEDGRHWNREGGCEARGGRAAKNARSRSFASEECSLIVRKDGHQRRNSVIQLESTDIGATTRNGPERPIWYLR